MIAFVFEFLRFHNLSFQVNGVVIISTVIVSFHSVCSVLRLLTPIVLQHLFTM